MYAVQRSQLENGNMNANALSVLVFDTASQEELGRHQSRPMKCVGLVDGCTHEDDHTEEYRRMTLLEHRKALEEWAKVNDLATEHRRHHINKHTGPERSSSLRALVLTSTRAAESRPLNRLFTWAAASGHTTGTIENLNNTEGALVVDFLCDERSAAVWEHLAVDLSRVHSWADLGLSIESMQGISESAIGHFNSAVLYDDLTQPLKALILPLLKFFRDGDLASSLLRYDLLVYNERSWPTQACDFVTHTAPSVEEIIVLAARISGIRLVRHLDASFASCTPSLPVLPSSGIILEQLPYEEKNPQLNFELNMDAVHVLTPSHPYSHCDGINDSRDSQQCMTILSIAEIESVGGLKISRLGVDSKQRSTTHGLNYDTKDLCSPLGPRLEPKKVRFLHAGGARTFACPGVFLRAAAR
jgi:hypothetical protein